MKNLLKTILICALFVFISCENDFVTKSIASIKGNPPPVPPPLINWSSTDFSITDATGGSQIVPEHLYGYLNNNGKRIWFNSKANGSNVEVTSQSFESGVPLDEINLNDHLGSSGTATPTIFTLTMGTNPLHNDFAGSTGNATIKLLPTMFVGADQSLGNGQSISFSVSKVNNVEYAIKKYESKENALLDATKSGSAANTITAIIGALTAYNIAHTGGSTLGTGAPWGDGICNPEVALRTAGSLIGSALSGYSSFVNTTFELGSLSWVTTPPNPDEFYEDDNGINGVYKISAALRGVGDSSTGTIEFSVKFEFWDQKPLP